MQKEELKDNIMDAKVCKTKDSNKQRKLKVCSINIGGLSERSRFMLDKYVSEKKIDVLCVQETGTADIDRHKLWNMNASLDELRAAMKEVYMFLKWKLTRIPEAFTLTERMIIEGKEYDQFSAMSIKACCYSKGLITNYSEFLWQGYINNIYQMEGECRIPTVSCQSLHMPVYTTRDQEVLFMSLFYKNNLMEAFLYSIKRANNPLCLCGVEAQTAVHAILHCSLVLNIKKAKLYESLGGVGGFSEDIVSFLDASRDKDFVNACIQVFKKEPKQFRTKIILEKRSKSTSQDPSLLPSASQP